MSLNSPVYEGDGLLRRANSASRNDFKKLSLRGAKRRGNLFAFWHSLRQLYSTIEKATLKR